jgi:hypothetical protein
LLLLLPTASLAAPKDVQPALLEELPRSERQSRFVFVVQELTAALAASPTWSVGSLGLYEFEFSVDNRLAFVHPDPQPGQAPSGWQATTEDGKPAPVVHAPRLSFRKGLPWSFEVGGDVGWMTATRQFVVGGYGRWAGLDGWTKVPDLAVQMGYHGYVGNDQLDLGWFDFDVSIGYTFDARSSQTRLGSRFSPFAGYTLLLAHGRPNGAPDGVQKVTAWADQAPAGSDPRDMHLHRAFGGVEVWTGSFLFRVSGEATFLRGGRPVAAANVSFGGRI